MKTSDIWNHFEETPIPRCKYCGMTIGQKKGCTTNMWSHLKSHHNDLLVFSPKGEKPFAHPRSDGVEDAIHHVQGCDSIAGTITSPPAGEDELVADDITALSADHQLEDLKQSATQLKEAMVSDSRGKLTDAVDRCIGLIARSFQATEETEEMVSRAVETAEPDDGGTAGVHSPYGHESGDTPSTSDENDGEVEPASFYLPTPKHSGTGPMLSGNETDELPEIEELESSSLYSRSKISAQQTVDDPMPEERKEDAPTPMPEECTPRKLPFDCKLSANKADDLTAKRMSRYDVHQLPANAPHGLKKGSSQLSGVHANNPENAQLRDFRPKPSASASITGPPTKRQRSPLPQVVSRHSAEVKVSCKKTSKKGKGKVCRRMTNHHKKVSSGKTNSLQRNRREELPTQDAGEGPTRKKKKGMEDTVGAAGVSGCEGRRRQPAPWTLVKND